MSVELNLSIDFGEDATPIETARKIASALNSKPEKYTLQCLKVYEWDYRNYFEPIFTLQFEEDTPPTLDELARFSGNHYSFVLEFAIKRDIFEGKMQDYGVALSIYGKDFKMKTSLFNLFNTGVSYDAGNSKYYYLRREPAERNWAQLISEVQDFIHMGAQGIICYDVDESLDPRKWHIRYLRNPDKFIHDLPMEQKSQPIPPEILPKLKTIAYVDDEGLLIYSTWRTSANLSEFYEELAMST